MERCLRSDSWTGAKPLAEDVDRACNDDQCNDQQGDNRLLCSIHLISVDLFRLASPTLSFELNIGLQNVLKHMSFAIAGVDGRAVNKPFI